MANSTSSMSEQTETLHIGGATVTFGNGFRVTSLSTAFNFDESISQIDTRFLSCTWKLSRRPVRLYFGNAEDAARVRGLFQTGRYQLPENQRIAGNKRNADGDIFYDINGWPWWTTEEDVRRAINPTSDLPLRIVLLPETRRCDPASELASVRSLLRFVGCNLEIFHTPGDHQSDPSILVQVPGAVSSLRKLSRWLMAAPTDMLGLPPGLKVQPKVAARLAIKLRILDFALNGEDLGSVLKSLEAKTAVRCHIYSSDPFRPGYGHILMEGETVSAIAGARDVIHQTLSESLLLDAGRNPLWNKSFSIKDLRDRLTQTVKVRYNVHAEFDDCERQVWLHGSPEVRHRAVRHLIRLAGLFKMVAISKAQSCRLQLPTNQKVIAALLQSPGVVVHAESRPHAELFVCTTLTEDAILEILDHWIDDTLPGKDNDAGIACPICLCQPSDPVKITPCKHVYCRSCLVSFCKSETKRRGDQGSVACGGAGGECGVILSIAGMKAVLSASERRQVFETSFAAFVGRHASKYRYCPTPDCGHIYNVTVQSALHLCQNCFRETCTACGNYHEPQAICLGQRAFGVDARVTTFDMALSQHNNAGSCPSCFTLIEKEPKGCNHVVCPVCLTHLCWACLAMFKTSRETYEHLDRVHGTRYVFGQELDDYRTAWRLQVQINAEVAAEEAANAATNALNAEDNEDESDGDEAPVIDDHETVDGNENEDHLGAGEVEAQELEGNEGPEGLTEQPHVERWMGHLHGRPS